MGLFGNNTVFKIKISSSEFIFDDDIIPTLSNVFDIGSPTKEVDNIYVEDLRNVSRLIAEPGNNIAIDLGDSIGGKSFLIRDSGNNTRFSINSDGDTFLGGKRVLFESGDGFLFGSVDRVPLFVNVTTAEKNALTAQNGMVVYDTDLNKFQGYENGAWVNLV